MLTRLKQWLKSPEFQGDEETSTMADILYKMGLSLLITLIFTAVVFVPIFASRKIESWIIIFLMSLLFFLARSYLFKGQLELAALIMTIPAWLLFYGIAFIGGGINSPLMPVIMTSTIVITFIVHSKIRYIFLFFGILGALGLALLQGSSLLPTQIFFFSPIASWFLFSLALIFIQIFISIVISNLRNSLKNVHEQSNARFQAEQALYHSEERFQKFMRFFPGLVYIKNSEGRVLFANQAFKTFLNIDPEEMIGKTNQVIFGEEFGEKIHRDDQRVLESQTSQVIEEEFGGRSWSTYKFNINQPDREPLLGGVTIDITEQKLVEKRLRESEFFFKESQRAANIGSFKTNLINETWESSEVLDQILGIEPASEHGLQTWLDIIHPEDLGVMIKYRNEEVIGKGKPFNKEYRIIRLADGTVRWVLELGQVLRDSNGEALSMIGTIQDITDKKEAEEALRDSENRFGNLLQNVSSVAVQGFRPDGTIEYWNKASEKVYGYTAREAIGQNLMDLIIPQESQDAIRRDIQKMIDTRQSLPPEEFTLRKKDGSQVSVISNQAIQFLPGRPPALYCIDIDVSERKKAEKVLAQTQTLIKAIFDNTTDLAWSVDPVNYSLLTWNPVYSEYFEKYRGVVVKMGMRPEDLYPANSGYVEYWKDLYQTVLEKGTVKTEYKVLGSPDTLQLNLNTLMQDNVPFGISIFGEIITERKKVEERIEQSEKKYRELFQVNKDGITIHTQSSATVFGNYLEVNQAAPKILGYTTAEMLALTPLDLEPTASESMLNYRYLELETAGTVTYETVFRNKGRKHVHVDISAQKIVYDGKPAIMNIIRDITDRKQHENELEVITSLSAALRTAPKRSEMLPVIVEQIVNLLDCDCATIEIIEPQTEDVVVEAAQGLWEELIGSRQKKGTGINALISETRKPFITQNLEKEPLLFYHEWARYGILGCIGMPLIAQEQLIGFIWIGRKSDISLNEVRLLGTITDIAANAIHRTTLHEQTKKDAEDLAIAYETTLEGWARALEMREQETAGHCIRVVKYTVDLAQYFGFDAVELVNVKRGASLHDIGKMGIPDRILLKKGPLTPKEWEIMRQHPVYAYNLLSQIPYLLPALDIPYFHHERWDGSGYPHGLKEKDIPLSARIFAVIDVWDALSSDRPYRKAWQKEEVLRYLKDQSGKQFDPEVVSAFFELIDRDKGDFKILTE